MSISAVLQFVHNDQNSITYTVGILMKMRTFVFYSLKCWNEIYSKSLSG